MSEEFGNSSGLPSDEMAQYLQIYLDETSEQLDALVESLLVLEGRPADAQQLNEAFRMIHSIKGSSAMMGFDSITVLTHHLENHFERLRSGLRELDQPTMGLILRCIDFLRECNRRMRAGVSLASAAELLEELNTLESGAQAVPSLGLTPPREAWSAATDSPITIKPTGPALEPAAVPVPIKESPAPRDYRVLVRFEPELALADLKAELVLARLGQRSLVRATQPAESDFGSIGQLLSFQVLLSTTDSPAEIRAAADVDGVDLVEITGESEFLSHETAVPAAADSTADTAGTTDLLVDQDATTPQPITARLAPADLVIPQPETDTKHRSAAAGTAVGESPDSRSTVVDTVRVEIDRLDNLLNLAGQLVVNKARFVQIAWQMSPAFKKSGISTRNRAFGESMRQVLRMLKTQTEGDDSDQATYWQTHIPELESEIDALEEQAKVWEESRRCFGQITEAIDQMTRVSDSLQRGVLETRMVPVAPLFNRFKRVVRDVALDLGKKVQLEIHGEKTELDKRMIDGLGDPLTHLVRNAIDHGIESAEMRVRRGKPETGTVSLEASHSGNHVLISIRDDGEGINIEKVRQRIVERGLVTSAAAQELSEREVIDFIWSPGFSTADVVSDISGRGVGMDIVKTRIAELNGVIDVSHSPGRGTTFTIRLPLTLAIIRSLLFRLRHGVFAVAIDSVREIVSVPLDKIVTINNRQTFEARGEFIPLVDIDEIFDWHSMQYHGVPAAEVSEDRDVRSVNVVILHAGGKAIGLKVNELHGSQDIVIKSLAENFVHIRGLSGASILGDGSVCLLLDVGAVIGLAFDPQRKSRGLELNARS